MSEPDIPAIAGKRLPRTYEEIFKRSLDERGRPVKSLDLRAYLRRGRD